MNEGDTAAATPFITSTAPLQTPGYRRINSYQGERNHNGRLGIMGPMASCTKKGGWVLSASYISDWIILIVVAVVGFVLGDITPNKRPFSLEDPNISFPYTIHETIPTWLLVVCSVIIPVVLIFIIAIIFVPGATVPKGTPKSLIWKRKLWELHTGWLGLALSLIAAWFITNGMKNLFGKPRPDLLARCQPNVANISAYVVGGIANISSNGQLVSAAICTNTDKKVLDDGFRSYPSGHSSSSAAGLIYLSLFIASKFAITIPFLAYASYTDDTQTSVSAFPSRMGTYNDKNNPTLSAPFPYKGGGPDSYELSDHPHHAPPAHTDSPTLSRPSDPALQRRLEQHSHRIHVSSESRRRQEGGRRTALIESICGVITQAVQDHTVEP
ncbi:hypothetical protein GE09DRAFT_1047823 [Coniochaeta sp. 2T2.1]|nr:hypothetical protein GE09DRAFT_1047823 [Coniochaeta sp. 2T2.1]